ncbi:MFS transporter [Streptomyces acidicola]|uniref:MFS transporter n=1 Tax=Streptomyces acidicola TaxID=2596892 RepID=UPI0034459373
MPHPAPVPTSAEVRSATRATYVAFTAAGFVFATWISRIPQMKAQLGLDPSALGLVLLIGAAGSVAGLLVAGPVVARFGPRRTVAVMALVLGAGMLTLACGYRTGVLPVVVGLFVFGFGQGGWDVAMNMQGAAVEQHGGRALLSRFHASYSVGTVAGGLVGAATIAIRLPMAAHLALVGVITAAVIPFSVRGFLPHQPASQAAATPMRAWRERRTLLIGVFILAFAFAEGTGNDWISVALVDDYQATPATGALGVAVFLAAMTLSRWAGPLLIGRYGRVRVLRLLAVVSLAGVALFAAELSTPLALAGALLWGVGVSLGFPVGLSAAADDPAMAAARVSVCSSIAYAAFLAGPSLIGFLGHEVTVVRAVAAVAPLLAVAVALAGVIHPQRIQQAADRAPAGTPEPKYQKETHS